MIRNLREELKSRKAALILLAGYYVFSLTTLIEWQKHDWFPPAGDEPHYLIMTSGIVEHRTLEQTLPYQDASKAKSAPPSGMASRWGIPAPTDTHARKGPHGLYNVHGIGLPLIVALAFAIAGVIGVKFFLVLLSGLPVLLAWKFSGLFTQELKLRILATMTTCFGLPLIPASNQVFPDLLGGIISLAAVTWMAFSMMGGPQALAGDLLVGAAIALQPWLQIKFAGPALICALALAFSAYCSDKRLRRASVFIIPLGMSLLLLAAYHQYAFGRFTGPYQGTVLSANLDALMVFLGLHLDQLQGIFLQNPAFLMGLAFMASFVAWNRLIGITTLLVYGSLVIPNAMFGNLYGGYCFGGRFVWSGAMVLIAPTVFGLVKLCDISRKSCFVAASVLGLLQVCFFVEYAFYPMDLYAKPSGTWLDVYPSLYSPLQEWLPAFYDRNWAFRYQPNYAFLILAIGLCVVGIVYLISGEKAFRMSLSTFLWGCGAYILAAGATSTPRYDPLNYTAASLLSETGQIEGDAIHAQAPRDRPGMVTYGPYVPLKSGPYRFVISYSSSSPSTHVVGKWDVTVLVRGRPKEISSGEIPGSLGVKAHISEGFEIPSVLSRHAVEVRTYFNGKSDLAIYCLTISKAD